MELQNNDIIKKGQAGRISVKKKLRGGMKKPAFQARQFPSSPRQNSPARRPVPAFRSNPAVERDSSEDENEDEGEEENRAPMGQPAMPERPEPKQEESEPKRQLDPKEQRDAGAEMRARKNGGGESQYSPGENSILKNPRLPEMPKFFGSQKDRDSNDTGKKEERRQSQNSPRKNSILKNFSLPEMPRSFGGQKGNNSNSQEREEKSFNADKKKEDIASDLLRRGKKKARDKVGESKNHEIYNKAGKLAKDVATGNEIKAFVDAAKLGLSLRKKISENKFEGGVFIAVLLIAIAKDLIDFLDMTADFGLVNFIFVILLFLVLFLKVPFIKKYLFKKLLWPIVIEFIPFISFFPSYVVSVIWLGLINKKKKRKAREDLDELEKKMGKKKSKK